SDPALSSPFTINFNIPNSDPGFSAGTGVWTVAPTSALPVIAAQVTINGYSQTGASPNSNGTAAADNAKIVIELSGAGAGTGVNGLVLASANSAVRGLSIVGFQADNTHTNGIAIAILAGGGDVITGNFIGVTPSGTMKLPNRTGIVVFGMAGNTIG